VTYREPFDEEQLALRLIQQAAVPTGEWPVFDFLLRELDRRGISDPQKCLEEIDSGLVRYEIPLLPPSLLRLSAQGWDLAKSGSTLIHDGFVTAIRQCVERVRHENFLSPSRPRELVVKARDLWAPDVRSELRLLGLLLESENLGEMTWDRSDTASPFKIKLDPLRIRSYASVGSFADFISICNGSTPLHAVA
jgi:hypothetical protein